MKTNFIEVQTKLKHCDLLDFALEVFLFIFQLLELTGEGVELQPPQKLLFLA